MINKRLLLILISAVVVLAVLLRIYQLGNVPPSPDWDEVALGYDAYSIIQTGKDEFGKFLPVVLRSFDDYKPALYAYLIIPAIFMFDLTTFAVRFPSAFFGIVSVVAVFFLVRDLFEKHKYRDYISIVASFLMAISPWSIQFSRVGFESNVGDALNILTVLFFVKGVKKPWLLILSAIFAGLSIYVYQSEKVFIPLLVLLLLVIYGKEILSMSKKYILAAFVIGVLVVAPMFFYIVGNRAALLRVTGTSIFSYQTELLKTNVQKLERDRENNDTLGLILDNRRMVFAKTIIAGYISHFDPNWIFIRGDISRHHAPNMGLIYLFELPFILFGIYLLLFSDFNIKTKLLIFGWFLLAPVPASITTGVPHAVRTLNFLPTFQILSALGLVYAFVYINKFKNVKYLAYLIFAAIFVFNFSYYLNQYFVQQNYYYVDEVVKLQDNYDNIVISDNQPMDKSYMFFLFYLKYSPSEYQKIGEKSSGSFDSHHSFGRYTFRTIDWQKDRLIKKTLYVGPPKDIPDGVTLIKTIYNLDGSVAIRIAGT